MLACWFPLRDRGRHDPPWTIESKVTGLLAFGLISTVYIAARLRSFVVDHAWESAYDDL